MSSLRVYLADAAATQQLGQRLANVVGPGCIALSGELGAGKTELARAMIHGLGYQGRVKSPTYTMVEPYETPRLLISHWDLYRIAANDELQALGIREQSPNTLMLVEWPERASDALPPVDLSIRIEHQGDGRSVVLTPGTSTGEQWVAGLPGSTEMPLGPRPPDANKTR